MADVLSLAQDLFDEAHSDKTLLQEYRSERKALLSGIRNGTGTGDIVAGTKNGASYTKRIGYSLDDRLSALRYAIQGLETGVRPGNVSRAFFT